MATSSSNKPRGSRRRAAIRAAFVVTASVGAAAGCDNTITNPPEPEDCPSPAPVTGESCDSEGEQCVDSELDGCGNTTTYTCEDGKWVGAPSGTCNPPPPTCGPDDPCGANEYCLYPDGLCGTGAAGECVPRPQECTEPMQSLDGACSCSGASAQGVLGACGAAMGGEDTWSALAAPCVDVAQFPCGGTLFCAVNEYCGTVPGPMTSQYTCQPLGPQCDFDDACGPSCVGELSLGCQCNLDDYGHPTVTCSG